MLVGVPKEIKDNEYRVGLVPSTVRELADKGHRVLVETGADQAQVCPTTTTNLPAPRLSPMPTPSMAVPSWW